MKITPVILCGGSGTRLWPVSREQFPKQFQVLIGEHSLFQQTVLRALQLDVCDAPLVICNQEHRFIVAEQLRTINCSTARILLEPVGRNTAPAIIMAALWQQQDTVLWVMPADHYLQDDIRLISAIKSASAQAQQGYLVTLGVVPHEAATAYGYIQSGALIAPDVFAVSAFVEKPSLVRAQQFLAQGDYLWNSGMFLFTAEILLREAKRYAPDMVEVCEKALGAIRDERDFSWLPPSFSEVPANSVDYAVMEKTQNACVVPLMSAWSDIGSWDALARLLESKEDKNMFVGDVVAQDVENTAIYASARLVAAVGVKDYVIVETPDAVLVLNKKYAQDVKQLVAQLKLAQRSEIVHHKRVYRPWGWYESLANNEGFQVKRISVKPEAELSLQSHQHRAEHWIVVKGQAEVTQENEVFILNKNQSTYIPAGHKHRLANRSHTVLELIEVQSGNYLGEDDIVRFEDKYGREVNGNA